MSLLDLKKHMMSVRMASLASLCALFKTDPETMRCLLSHWMRKGCVRKCTKKPACATKCFKCPVADIEMYEWAESL
jgi:hypothetical protein